MVTGLSNRGIIGAIFAGLLIGGLAAVGLYLSANNQKPVNANAQFQSGTAQIGGPFTLRDQNGKKVTEQAFKGARSILIFGNSIADPLSAASIQVALEAAHKTSGSKRPVRIFFVTLDLNKDTQTVLQRELARFSGQVLGLTGEESETARLATSYRLPLGKPDRTAEYGPRLLRPFIFVLDAEGRYVSHKVMPIRVTDLTILLEHASQ